MWPSVPGPVFNVACHYVWTLWYCWDKAQVQKMILLLGGNYRGMSKPTSAKWLAIKNSCPLDGTLEIKNHACHCQVCSLTLCLSCLVVLLSGDKWPAPLLNLFFPLLEQVTCVRQQPISWGWNTWHLPILLCFNSFESFQRLARVQAWTRNSTEISYL